MTSPSTQRSADVKQRDRCKAINIQSVNTTFEQAARRERAERISAPGRVVHHYYRHEAQSFQSLEKFKGWGEGRGRGGASTDWGSITNKFLK